MRRFAFVISLLTPVAVLASTTVHWDVSSGALGQLVGKSLGLAKGFFVLCLVAGLMWEAFGKSPLEGKDYGRVAFRAVVVLVMLALYPPLIGRVLAVGEGLTRQLAPADVWQRYTQQQMKWQERALGGSARETLLGSESSPSLLGGYVFDSFLAVAVLLGQASHWVMGILGRVLAALLCVVGPFALVFSIPGHSGAGLRWFRLLCNVMAWPALSALLLSITVEVGLDGMATTGAGAAFSSLASALLMAAIACATPVLASALVGSGVQFVGAGVRTVTGVGARIGVPTSFSGNENSFERKHAQSRG